MCRQLKEAEDLAEVLLGLFIDLQHHHENFAKGSRSPAGEPDLGGDEAELDTKNGSHEYAQDANSECARQHICTHRCMQAVETVCPVCSSSWCNHTVS